ncbi:MAG: phosphatase PAP2 family protein [Chloroflexi bacterium]|nr:phosphatase PAP2 family protein [Chloroflexota bacterium]
MNAKKWMFFLLVGGILLTLSTLQVAAQSEMERIEPEAGAWPTWLLESGSQFRLDAPPDATATADEIAQLMAMADARDDDALRQIAYWDAGPPSYRWNEMAVAEISRRGIPGAGSSRVLALLHAGIYDATIAAWDSKYAHNRPRPSEVDSELTTAIPTPASPSYPSEYAATAGAAAAILSWLFPDSAERFEARAQAAVQSRLLAGVEYPSDVEAGLELGRQVAELAIAHGQADGSDAPWEGTVPTDPTGWTGQNPAAPQSGKWKTWVLTSPDQFRPGPRHAHDSEELAAEMEELRTYERTPVSNGAALYWEYGSGSRYNNQNWNDRASRLILSARWHDNAPQAARAYALMNISSYDALVACFDAKYAYWAIRPFQYDPEFTPLFTTPNHPSYPAAHSCNSMSSAAILVELFPLEAEELMAVAHEAGEARIWGGIHFRSDVVAGQTLGMDVANAVLARGMPAS